MKERQAKRGVTLMELLIVLVVLAIVVTSVITLINFLLRGWRFESNRTELERDAKRIMEDVSQHLRDGAFIRLPFDHGSLLTRPSGRAIMCAINPDIQRKFEFQYVIYYLFDPTETRAHNISGTFHARVVSLYKYYVDSFEQGLNPHDPGFYVLNDGSTAGSPQGTLLSDKVDAGGTSLIYDPGVGLFHVKLTLRQSSEDSVTVNRDIKPRQPMSRLGIWDYPLADNLTWRPPRDGAAPGRGASSDDETNNGYDLYYITRENSDPGRATGGEDALSAMPGLKIQTGRDLMITASGVGGQKAAPKVLFEDRASLIIEGESPSMAGGRPLFPGTGGSLGITGYNDQPVVFEGIRQQEATNTYGGIYVHWAFIKGRNFIARSN